MRAEAVAAKGSSPLTRGALGGGFPVGGCGGLIPAYAGSTPTPLGGKRISGAHPRLRGEHGIKCCA